MGLANVYSKMFAKGYDRFTKNSEIKELSKRRKALLSDLKGNVLEIGAGTGVNFQYYSKEANVLAIEPSLDMLKQAEEKKKDKQNIRLLQASVETCYKDKLIQKGSMDAIVCTLVLCTIPDPQKALYHFHKWLKPDGILIVIEHIRSYSPWKGKMQDLVVPFWKVLGQGCHLNRKTDQMIRQAGFEALKDDYFSHHVLWYQGIFRKTKNSIDKVKASDEDYNGLMDYCKL